MVELAATMIVGGFVGWSVWFVFTVIGAALDEARYQREERREQRARARWGKPPSWLRMQAARIAKPLAHWTAVMSAMLAVSMVPIFFAGFFVLQWLGRI